MEEVKERRVKIILDEDREAGTHSRQYVSVNGKDFWLTKGLELEIPESVVEVLKNAIQTEMYMNTASGEIIYKNVPRFSFKIIK